MFKTMITAATAVAIGVTALTSTTASAKVFLSTHSSAPRVTPGTIPASITTGGLPGKSGNSAPSRPSASPNPPVPNCLQPTPSGMPRCG
jgi:hypothetical protein